MCYDLWYNSPTMSAGSLGGIPQLPSYRPATSWVHYTTSCNTQSSAPEDARDHRPKHVELIGIINKPLLLHLVGVYIIRTQSVSHNVGQTVGCHYLHNFVENVLYQHVPYCQPSNALRILMFHDSVILRLPQIMVSADRIRGKNKIIRKAKYLLSKRAKL